MKSLKGFIPLVLTTISISSCGFLNQEKVTPQKVQIIYKETCPVSPHLTQKDREFLKFIKHKLQFAQAKTITSSIVWENLSKDLRCQVALLIAAKALENLEPIPSQIKYEIGNSCNCYLLDPWQQVVVLKLFNGQVPEGIFATQSILKEVR